MNANFLDSTKIMPYLQALFDHLNLVDQTDNTWIDSQDKNIVSFKTNRVWKLVFPILSLHPFTGKSVAFFLSSCHMQVTWQKLTSNSKENSKIHAFILFKESLVLFSIVSSFFSPQVSLTFSTVALVTDEIRYFTCEAQNFKFDKATAFKVMQLVQHGIYIGAVLNQSPYWIAASLIAKGVEELSGAYHLWDKQEKMQAVVHGILGGLRLYKGSQTFLTAYYKNSTASNNKSKRPLPQDASQNKETEKLPSEPQVKPTAQEPANPPKESEKTPLNPSSSENSTIQSEGTASDADTTGALKSELENNESSTQKSIIIEREQASSATSDSTDTTPVLTLEQRKIELVDPTKQKPFVHAQPIEELSINASDKTSLSMIDPFVTTENGSPQSSISSNEADHLQPEVVNTKDTASHNTIISFVPPVVKDQPGVTEPTSENVLTSLQPPSEEVLVDTTNNLIPELFNSSKSSFQQAAIDNTIISLVPPVVENQIDVTEPTSENVLTSLQPPSKEVLVGDAVQLGDQSEDHSQV